MGGDVDTRCAEHGTTREATVPERVGGDKHVPISHIGRSRHRRSSCTPFRSSPCRTQHATICPSQQSATVWFMLGDPHREHRDKARHPNAVRSTQLDAIRWAGVIGAGRMRDAQLKGIITGKRQQCVIVCTCIIRRFICICYASSPAA